MKVCSKCGKQNTDDSLFCEECGEKIVDIIQQTSTQPKAKKSPVLVIGIVAGVVVIIAFVIAIFFLLNRLEQAENKAPSQEKKQVEIQSEQKETEEKTASTEINYAAADINAVDNVYIDMAGKIENVDGNLVLIIDEPLSVAVYNEKEEIELIENVTEFTIEDKSSYEEYAGAMVSVNTKISKDVSGKLCLQIVKLNVEKAAVSDEDVEFENHEYMLIVKDVTWQEAFDDCKRRGGNLVQINSAEEFQKILEMIEGAGHNSVHFYLGGRRDLNGTEYFWLDENNNFVGSNINPGSGSWADNYWMEGEPSYIAGDSEEMYMNLFYYKNEWILNDVPNDITIYYPGKTGYICEFAE